MNTDFVTFSEFASTQESLSSILHVRKTDQKIMLACPEGSPDVAIIFSTRTRKTLRVTKLTFLRDVAQSVVEHQDKEVEMALNPSAPSKVQVLSHAFSTSPFYDFQTKQL